MREIRFTSEFFIVVVLYTQSFCRQNGLDVFVFIPSTLLVFCIVMDIYSKRKCNYKISSFLNSFRDEHWLKGLLMEVGSPFVLYILLLGLSSMEENVFLSFLLIFFSILYYIVMIVFFIIVKGKSRKHSKRKGSSAAN